MIITKITFAQEKMELSIEPDSMRYVTHPDRLVYEMTCRERQAGEIKKIIDYTRHNRACSGKEAIEACMGLDYADYTIKELPKGSRVYVLNNGISIFEADIKP